MMGAVQEHVFQVDLVPLSSKNIAESGCSSRGMGWWRVSGSCRLVVVLNYCEKRPWGLGGRRSPFFCLSFFIISILQVTSSGIKTGYLGPQRALEAIFSAVSKASYIGQMNN